MSAISFNEMPNNVRLNIFAVEFDPSNAIRGAQNQIYKALLVGQKLPGGNAATLKPVRVSGKQDAINKFGAGSMLAEQVDYYRRVDPITELLAIAVPDDDAAVKATATIAVTGTASEPGALYLYINAVRLTVAIRSGDAAATVTAAIVAKVNAESSLPVTAFVSTDKVTLEAKHPGETGNDLDARLNFYTGEYTPAGLAITITPFTRDYS